ncbi:hypothetical protein BGZ61DRAFT_486482 [Ilyonectria robusta]|uniref:uncharacterized protein n=1 Tax=Ilyonectria robusta TaxID=1079257 RepID=UPI001E8EC417|nr:uncharacterized protein BGZ61DRAFT_486482 [Ilyonectria robusta]KAH8656832.1 hypothetical protein BGZ61DRAFT_486482 [Ilyonectria robusta]
MFKRLAIATALGVVGASAAGVTYPVPTQVPSGAVKLDSTPLGVSFEFFMWPSYMTNITPPLQCLDHFSTLYGKKIPIRIGGTTQDRATYDPDFQGYVSYHVDNPLDAPMSLTYGPKFFDLIPEFGAETMLGFNRGNDNITNTLEAVMEAKARAGQNLGAIELGNEPDLYYSIWNKPIAVAPWNNSQEGGSAAEWAQAFINRWKSPLPILSAGAYAVPIPLYEDYPDTNYLINEAYNASVKAGTKSYCTHLYALSSGTTLSTEMNHLRTVSDLSHFVDKIATAKSINRPYIIGETGFHGLDEEMDATFGGALQVLDKTLLALSIGIERLYYHQGTINQAFFNWWSDDQVEAPFYGAWMAGLALQGADHIVASDDGTNSFAQYILYKRGKPFKAVLINTDYYSGTGKRNSTTFTLKGLKSAKIKALRMIAPSSDVTTSLEQANPSNELTIGGQYFKNSDCSIKGKRKLEVSVVQNGKVTFKLAASEAILVYF